MAALTALRRSEMCGLKWEDIDFDGLWLNLKRGLVGKNETKMKTEASRKSVEMDPALAEALLIWRGQTPYPQGSEWVFASPHTNGQRPYWPDMALKRQVRPAAVRALITKQIGWHTFRHSLATVLGHEHVDVKVIQELLRQASSKITMDVYQQGSSEAKRSALSRMSGICEVPQILTI